MAHTGPLSNTVAVHYDPLKKHEAIDGLGATNNKRLVGTQTLVGQQQRLVPPTATPASQPAQSRVREWVKWFIDRTVVPAVDFFGAEALVQLAPEEYQDLIRPLAHFFSATVAKPAMEWLSHQVVDALADPKTFMDSVKDTAEKAKADPWSVASQVLSLPKSKAEAGKAARELILGSTDAGATMLMLKLASEATGSKTIATVLEGFAPYFARTVRNLVDFTLDRAVPMHEVAPEDVPKPSDTLNLCTIWPATVASVSGKLQGSYDATINFKPGLDSSAALTGSAVVTVGAQKRIIGIKDLSGARLVLGGADKYALTALATTAFGEHTGWALSAGQMRGVAGKAKAKQKAKPTLRHLTVSPTGWIDGEFVRAGKLGRLGGKANDGAQWPLESATTTTTPAPRAVPPGGTLEGHVNGAIVRHYNKWLLGGGLAVVGWLTEHANLLPKQDPTPEDVAQASTKTWLQKLHLDPSDLIDNIASIDLVPDFLRTGYPKLTFNPYELKVGHEPSLAFSMSTSLQLFESIGTASASGVVIAWLPFGGSKVQVRADKLKFGEGLIVDGMELDPAGGVRTRHAMLKVPLPAAFSLPNVQLSADYLTVGPTIGFRNAGATMKGFTIADVLTVESLAVSVKQPNKDPRFSAAAKGAVNLPGVKELTFDGEVQWGGGETMDGRGTVNGAGISEKGFSAKQIGGTLLVKKGVASGTLTATDFAIEWNGYTLKTNASVTVDRQGIEKLSIDDLAVWKSGVQVGAASNVTYDRTQGQLTVGRLALDLPETGSIRATKEKKRGGTPQLVTTDLDLSSLVQQPAKAAPAKDAPPKAEAPKPKPGLAVENLGKLELGPDPALLTLNFAKAKAAKPEGGVAAYVSGNLRGFTLDEKLLQVEPSAKNAADVRVTLSGMRGAGYAIETATYDAGILEVTNADIQLDKLLGKSVPDALRGLTSNVKTSFTIDTHAGKLLALTAHGALTGQLFNGAVTITKATADLHAKSGTIADGLTDGFALAGSIAGTVKIKAYGVDATLSGDVAFPGGTPTFSGSGTKDTMSIDITGVTFVDGKPTFESATVKIGAPMSELVKFFPSPSENVKEADHAKIVAWVAKKVEATADTGMPQATQSEQLVDPSAPAREIGVHLPEIHVGGDAFVLKADDVVVAEGKDQTVSLGASARLRLGIVRGDVQGHVKMTIRGKDPMPDPKSLAFDVASATLGGLAMTGIHYAEGRLSIDETTARTPAVLGHAPADFGLENIAWTGKNLAIDLASKTVTAEKLGATVTDISTLGGALSIRSASAEVGIQGAPLDRTSLIPANWAVTLAATGARIGTDVLSIGGSAKLVIDRNGLRDGEITEASLRAGVGAASVGKIALTPDGWNASEVKLVVGNATKLGFDPIASLPAWLKTAADCQVQVTFPLSYSAKKLHWPSLSDVKVDVLKAGIKLPGGISGAFDRTAGKRTASFAAKPPKAGFSVGLQVPLAQGIGIEFGGSLEHQVSLEANDVELKDSDRLEFAGKVAGKAALKGRVRVGVFGGVPALFTVSAGIYAGLDLNAVLAADATGSWDLPKTAGKDTSGNVQLYLSMSDSATPSAQTSLTGEAGAYASVHVLGFGRTIEKSLAKAEIATIFAHGFAELSTDHGLRLLPTGAFPTHALHLHPTLEEKLTGGDAKQAIKLAYQTIDRGVGKMEASEELLARVPKTTPDTATPYKELSADLDRAEKATARTAAASDAAVTTLEGALKRDRDWLEQARKKLTQYEADRKALPVGKTLLARAALPGDVTARLANYGKDLGRAAKKTQLNADALQARIDAKKEEIEVLEERIAENEEEHLAKRVEHTNDVNANHKATKKAKLSKLSQGKVKEDLAWRQRRLLEMYGTLQTAHKTATSRAAQSAGKTVKLEQDKTIAERHVARLDADPHASATEKKFWTEQLTFVTAELKRVKAEAAPAPIALSTKAKLAVKRASDEHPEIVAQLSDKVMAELAKYEAKIEATTRSLSENMQELAKLGDGVETESDRAPLEKKRRDLLVELHKAQDKLAGALAREEDMSA